MVFIIRQKYYALDIIDEEVSKKSYNFYNYNYN